MHHRCVFSMLKSCVLVGLDWVEPMMYLLLHATCSCIFHAYVQFLSFLLILTVFGTFLHLSLSLFLLVSLLMAPRKSKSTPSQNPLRSEASSSSFVDPTPFHVRFHDDKARKDFSENFSQCSIHSEHQVILLDFSNTDLPIVIHSRGWESLCDILVTCPFMIIQEFYSNMHRFDYSVPHFITRVRGPRIVVTSDLISEVLHVPRVEFANYPGCPRLRTVSKDELSSLFCETPLS